MGLFDLVRMTVVGAPGTGSITLGAAITGFRSFDAAGVPDGGLVTYGIVDGTSREIGYGTYTKSGASLDRTALLASSTGSKLDLTSTAIVFITPAAEDIANTISIQAPNPYYAKLGLTQTSAVDQNSISSNATMDLGLTQISTVDHNSLNAAATEDLGLTQIAAIDQNTINVTITEDLGLTQTSTVDHNTISAMATEDLGLTQTSTVDHNSLNAAATEDLGLTQSATVTGFNVPAPTLLINAQTAVTSNTYTVSVGASVPAGSLIFGFMGSGSSANPPSSAGDSQNGTTAYTLVQGSLGAFARYFYFVNSKALSASDTFTFTFTGTGTAKMALAAYSTNINAYDGAVVNGATGTSTTPAVTTGTPTYPNDLLTAVTVWNSNTVLTQSANWTSLASSSSGSFASYGYTANLAYRVKAAAIAESISESFTGSSALWFIEAEGFEATTFT